MDNDFNALDALDIATRLNGVTYPNHPTHNFGGIDGRCFWCDCRPYGAHAPKPCPVN